MRLIIWRPHHCGKRSLNPMASQSLREALLESDGVPIIAGSSLNPVPFPSAGEIHKPGVDETLFRRYRNGFEKSFSGAGADAKQGRKPKNPSSNLQTLNTVWRMEFLALEPSVPNPQPPGLTACRPQSTLSTSPVMAALRGEESAKAAPGIDLELRVQDSELFH
jgi:hypothetical protein